MTGAEFSWDRENRTAAGYAARHLGGQLADPADFGAVWANMTRGFHVGELRDLPPLEAAFADWLHELRLHQDESRT
ncbi:hypothetical protein [Actinokineospora sp. UTMC 2448]|uniref:hypothetical protein n=1 Tax=Actinokineospora sp. UTMC 2448 TaxID=2268449 RepID=UPI0021645775|nr:hypothetical protein [Actinokineospora sp. UTMC 2448]UVS79138.1 hypothetical protein Actkin_02884 [Actinokineospora sp. UTMC 2448]